MTQAVSWLLRWHDMYLVLSAKHIARAIALANAASNVHLELCKVIYVYNKIFSFLALLWLRSYLFQSLRRKQLSKAYTLKLRLVVSVDAGTC
jgi:hypothetical protein